MKRFKPIVAADVEWMVVQIGLLICLQVGACQALAKWLVTCGFQYVKQRSQHNRYLSKLLLKQQGEFAPSVNTL
jgi:hypothetical protein